MALNSCEELPAGAQYVDGMEMPQQTEDWHRALQGTPPQMGILEGQLRSKLWLWLWAHTMQHLLQCPLLEQVCTPEDLAAYHKNVFSTLAGQHLMLCGFDKYFLAIFIQIIPPLTNAPPFKKCQRPGGDYKKIYGKWRV